MQQPSSLQYFQNRAEEEHEAAAQAADARAARSHLELAAAYEKLARGFGESASDDEPDDGGTLRKEFRILP
jgi:hypothetical protein